AGAADGAGIAAAEVAAGRAASLVELIGLEGQHAVVDDHAGIEALPIAAAVVAGELEGTAGLLLDEGAFIEDPGQAGVAGRTAFAIAALERVGTAVEAAGTALGELGGRPA